jgi:predicted nuclease with TOPRIM domain
MNEDLTQGLPPRSFEERVLAELSGIRQELTGMNSRLTSLEEKVDARLRETRPIWEGVLARLTGIESELARMNRQFRSFVADIFQLRVRVEKLEEDEDQQMA